MKDISFIIPAKNAALFICDALDGIKKINGCDWEAIVIDDNSEDDTYNIIKNYSEIDNRIIIAHNPNKGKVSALNYGYSLCRGNTVKCLDSDDTVSEEFYEHIKTFLSNDVTCHDYYMVDANMNRLSIYAMNKGFFSKTFPQVFTELLSLPRAVWSFSREIADRIFPIPEQLPYEDLWFSLIIKKYTDKVTYINKPLYNYRQHANQTFGGVLNYSKDKTIFRANRILKYIEVLQQNLEFREYTTGGNLDYQNTYYTLLAKDPVSVKEILTSGLFLRDRLKLYMFRKVPGLISVLKRMQWKLEKFR